MTLSDLTKYSVPQSVARSLCDSWASCSRSYIGKQKYMFCEDNVCEKYSNLTQCGKDSFIDGFNGSCNGLRNMNDVLQRLPASVATLSLILRQLSQHKHISSMQRVLTAWRKLDYHRKWWQWRYVPALTKWTGFSLRPWHLTVFLLSVSHPCAKSRLLWVSA